jgi:hypothetical protein
MTTLIIAGLHRDVFIVVLYTWCGKMIRRSVLGFSSHLIGRLSD